MSLDNLILQVNFPGDSDNYSQIIKNLIKLSDSNYHSDIIDSQGKLLTSKRAYSLISKINEEVDYDKNKFFNSFKSIILEYNDIFGIKISETNKKLIFPTNVDYRSFKDSECTLINADYQKNEYIGLIEHIKFIENSHREKFNPGISAIVIDEDFNSKLKGNKYINLYRSDNFCRTVIEFIADYKNEKIDIDKALEYFIGKPLSFVSSTIDTGFGQLLQSEFDNVDFYQKFILRDYIKNTHHKEKSHNVKMKTLILPDYNLSRVAYQKLCDYTKLPMNEEKFSNWHRWLFDGDYCFDETSIPSLLNIISKLLLGEKFSPDIWTIEAQVVFNYAVEEKLGITDGVTAYKEYINNGSRT